ARLLAESGLPLWAACAQLAQAVLAGRRGDTATATELAAQAERVLLTGGVPPLLAAPPPAGRRVTRAATRREGHLRRARRRCLGRARPPGAARGRRAQWPASPAGPGPAGPARAANRAARGGRAEQPGDRPAALPIASHRPQPPVPDLPQAGHHVTHRASSRRRRLPRSGVGHRLSDAAPTAGRALSAVGGSPLAQYGPAPPAQPGGPLGRRSPFGGRLVGRQQRRRTRPSRLKVRPKRPTRGVQGDRLIRYRLRRIPGAGLGSFSGPSSLAFCLPLGGD